MTPDQLKAAVPRGMLAFPLTDFDANDAFDKKSHVARLEWLLSYQPAAFFLAGGPDFGILGEGYVRLSYANSTENILKALARTTSSYRSEKQLSSSRTDRPVAESDR